MHPGRRTLFSAHTAAVAEVAAVEPLSLKTPEKVPQRTLSKEIAKEPGDHGPALNHNAPSSTEGQRPMPGLVSSSKTGAPSTYHERSISLLLQSLHYPNTIIPTTVVLLLVAGKGEGTGQEERKGPFVNNVKSAFERVAAYLRNSPNGDAGGNKPTPPIRYVTISDSVSSTLERRLLQLKEEFTESDEHRRLKLLEGNKEKPGGLGAPPDPTGGKNDSLNSQSQGASAQLSIVLVDDELNHRASHRTHYLAACSPHRGSPLLAVTVASVVSETVVESTSGSTPSDPSKRKRGRTEEDQQVQLPTLEEGFDLLYRFG
jgi:hypothetical protein